MSLASSHILVAGDAPSAPAPGKYRLFFNSLGDLVKMDSDGTVSVIDRSSEAFESLMVGDVAAGNYTNIEADGSISLIGDATMWDDIVGSLIARRLESTTGRLQYSYKENAIIMQNAGDIALNADRLMFSYQKPHAAKEASGMHLHIHWEQPDALDREFTVQYRIQSNGAEKETVWNTVIVSTAANSKFAYTSGTLNQITELCIVDLSTAGISATVQFRLARTDSAAGDILATFVDAHVEFDSLGSRQEYVK